MKRTVKENKTEINKEQVEDNKSKAVKGKTDIIKISEEKATYRDYSGKIRYVNSYGKPKNEKNSEKSKKGFEKFKKAKQTEKRKESVIKEQQTINVVKPENTNNIIREGDTAGVIKPKDNSDIIKGDLFNEHKTTALNNGNENKSSYNKAVKSRLKKQVADKAKKARGTVQGDVYKQSLEHSTENNIVKPETKFNVIEHKAEDSIISDKHDYSISAASREIAEGVVTYTDSTQRSKLSKMAHQKQLESMRNCYKDDVTADTNNEVFEYRGDEERAKQQAYAEMVRENTLPINEHREPPIKSTTSQKWKKQVKGKSNKTKPTTITTLGVDAVKSSVQSAMKNSDDETLQLAEKTVTAVSNAKAILKPETVSVKKRTEKLNREALAKNASNLGIKAELKQDVKNIVLDANASSGELLKVGGKSVIKAVREDISEKGENDLAFKAVDDVIKTGETAVGVKRVYTATKNSIKNLYNAGEYTVKGIAHTPKNIRSAFSKAQKAKHKFDSYKRLQTRQKIALIKSKAGSTTKKLAETTVKSAKSAVIKLFAVLLVNIVLIVAICGLVVGMIGSFIWQTPSALDTTAIIKFISEKDYGLQRDWANKGLSNVAIDAKNDNTSGKNYHYIYALTVDVDPNTPVVKTSVNSDGEERKPTYSGFNKVFYSYDEMLETYRWTTDDYRAALAYIQTKKENLGWFSTFFGFVGEGQLKSAASDLFDATYKYGIRHIDTDTDGIVTETQENPIYTKKYSKNNAYYEFYFGKKYSVKYLIDNDMIRFSSDDAKNASMKEKFYYTYKYGNFAVANLTFPLEKADDETIESRISKHFGKQLVLKYDPPEQDPDKTVYGTISKSASWHLATDLSADEGDIIYAPISGLCVATQREERGFEYVISTSYSGNAIDYTKDGFLIKISCSSGSFISASTPTVVHQGDSLGLVAHNIGVNINVPQSDNDTNYEDILADKLFPCCTGTAYHDIGGDEFDVPEPERDHIHIEMYKLPCDFTNATDIEKNILAPELFFDYSDEE